MLFNRDLKVQTELTVKDVFGQIDILEININTNPHFENITFITGDRTEPGAP